MCHANKRVSFQLRIMIEVNLGLYDGKYDEWHTIRSARSSTEQRINSEKRIKN